MNTENFLSIIADSPDQPQSQLQHSHLDELTWSGSLGDIICQCRVNDRLAAWMDENLMLMNWLHTCIACHLENRILHPQEYTVPSNFADTIGAKKITIEIFNRIGRYDQSIKTEVHVMV
jgi:hypothetical protein